MTFDELNAFTAKQVSAYKAVVSPEDQLATKKFFRDQLEYKGKVVALRGILYESPDIGGTHTLRTLDRESWINVRGITSLRSKVISFGENFFVVGNVDTILFPPHAPRTWAQIVPYRVCGIISDTAAKKAEVLCETLKKP